MRREGPKRAAWSFSSIARLLSAGGIASSSAAASFSNEPFASPSNAQRVGEVAPDLVRVYVYLHDLRVVGEHRGREAGADGEEDVVVAQVLAEVVGAGLQGAHAEVVRLRDRALALVGRHDGGLQVLGDA